MAGVADSGSDGPLTGRVLARKYRLGRLLGVGASGPVYAAGLNHQPSHEPFAIKLIGLYGAQHLEEARAEAQMLASMTSPHIVRLEDFLVLPGGEVAVVMERIDGRSLEDELTSGPMEMTRACRIVSQVGIGLGHAHDRGVVHRDIKPSNILLERTSTEPDFVRLVDFGISAHVDELTRTMGFYGTPRFASPEQFLGEPLTASADVYALGVTLFNLLTGEPPFDETHLMGAANAHLRTPAPALRQRLRFPFPPELEELVGRMLDKDPSRRPQDVRVVAWALDRIAQEWSSKRGLDEIPKPDWFQTSCALCEESPSCRRGGRSEACVHETAAASVGHAGEVAPAQPTNQTMHGRPVEPEDA